MILDKLTNLGTYTSLGGNIKTAISFLQTTDLAALEPGQKYAIDGDKVFAMVSKDSGRNRDDAKLETHRNYIDIQIVLEGTDEMGWKSLDECTMPENEYDTENDYQLFLDKIACWIPVGTDMFTIFFPHDAHAPLISDGVLHKIVVKVAV